LRLIDPRATCILRDPPPQFKFSPFGLVVDGLADPEEIVVKPLSSALKGIGLYSGATVLGNGDLALILDPGSIDWNMPVMDGLDMLRHLRAEGFSGIKVMMVTTEAENDFIVRALDAGADEYLMKPFDGEAMAEKLAMLGLGEN